MSQENATALLVPKGAHRLFFFFLNVLFILRYPILAGQFFRQNRRFPNVSLPRRYNDRIQWRKIFDHNPMFAIFADKLTTKEFISNVVPELALPKVFWIGDHADKIPREILAGNVAVKASHGSGFSFFIRNGAYDWNVLRSCTRRWLSEGAYGWWKAEWAYSQVSPKLFVEELLSVHTGDLIDICIRAGRERFAFGSLIFNAKTSSQIEYYINTDRKVLGGFDWRGNLLTTPSDFSIPDVYNDAINLACTMSREIDYARFDFLCSGGTLYGGEITVYPASGYKPIREFTSTGYTLDPGELNAAISQTWDFCSAWFLNTKQEGWREYYRKLLLRYADAL